MAEADDKKGKYTVVLVKKGTTKYLADDAVVKIGAVPPRYDKQTDEAAFQVAWKKVGQVRAQGSLKPKPKLNEDSIKLRGSRKKSSCGRLAEVEGNEHLLITLYLYDRVSH